MAYVPTATLFAIGGSPASPLDLGDTNGYAAGTKAHGFGEVITSARLNRLGYALSLNTDDVDARLQAQIIQHNNDVSDLEDADTALGLRIAPFEATGLDAAYRLGVNDVAGGGRVIDVDGGAVELRTSDVGQYQRDIANAAFRIDSTTNPIQSSSVGIDIVSKAVGAGAARYGLLERYQYEGFQPGGGGGSTYIPPGSPAILNPTGSGSSLFSVVLLSPGHTGFPTTVINPGSDFLEITGGNNDGLYVISAVMSDVTILVSHLGGGTPVFTQADSVTITMYRGRALSGLDTALTLQEIPNQTGEALRINALLQDALAVYGGIGDLTKTFSVDGAGQVTAGEYKYNQTVTRARAVTLSLIEGAASGDTVEFNPPRYRFTPSGTTATIRMILNLDIPYGAVIQEFQVGLRTVNVAHDATINITTLKQIAAPTDSAVHGGTPVNSTLTTIASDPSDVLLTGGVAKTAGLTGIGATYSDDQVYYAELYITGISVGAKLDIDIPAVTYEYDTL